MGNLQRLLTIIGTVCFVASLPIQLIGLIMVSYTAMFAYASSLIIVFGYLIYRRQKRLEKQLEASTKAWFPKALEEYKRMVAEAERRKRGTAAVSS